MAEIDDHAAPVPVPNVGRHLRDGWTFTSTAPGVWGTPADIPSDGIDWKPAIVPGTVAASLRALGDWSLDTPTPLHDRDHWYRCRLNATGPRDLVLEGLATFAEIYLGDRLILESQSMFLAHRVAIEASAGVELSIVFRSLAARLETLKPKRARWRTALIPDQRLRAVRTTLLGHMPGCCPPVDTIGPWRPIRLVDPADVTIEDVRMTTAYDGGTGTLTASLKVPSGLSPERMRLTCAAHAARLTQLSDGRLGATLRLPGITPWWPHTHGEPALHPVEIDIDGVRHGIGRVGFRRIEINRGPDGDGFGLVVNGVEIFARGVVWMPGDSVALSGDVDAYRAELGQIRDAGLNMVRVSGITAYEAADFHALCDELGILVWQDLMFANFDYPTDDAFVATIEAEAEQLMARLQSSPSLAVVCGGSEITQQAAMLGLPPASWANPLFDDILPGIVARVRPDVAWIRSTPDGGEMPFVADKGVTHYFGVGAYRRPLEDARRANMRFAAECLAFAHVPEQATLDACFEDRSLQDPRWKQRVPRDNGADWDFEDIRQFYEAALFGPEVAELRAQDPGRALDVSRATTAHVVETTMSEWRRPGSTARGALVLSYKDPWIGAGWGYVDALGTPKSSWHALARASQPLVAFLTDEGVNGLDVHVVNDRPDPVTARLQLTCYAHGRIPVASGGRDVRIAPHGSLTLAATTLFGRFFDTTYAYRFGPRAHDLSHVQLLGAAGEALCEGFHFPGGRSLERRDCGLAVRLEDVGTDYDLVVSCSSAAISVVIEDHDFLPADNGFHLAPGERRIRLHRRRGAGLTAKPAGRVRALNTWDIATY